MDWAWLYATLIRNAGWTFEQCRATCMADALMLIEQINEWQPAYAILSYRYGIDPESRAKKAPRAVSGAEASAIAQMIGGAGSPMSEDMAARKRWAFEGLPKRRG